MMIRSTPPRSANFAEMPVPAPAPMIGLPRRDLARAAGESDPSYGMNGIGALSVAAGRRPVTRSREQFVRERVGERRIVDVRVDLVTVTCGRRCSRSESNSARSASGS